MPRNPNLVRKLTASRISKIAKTKRQVAPLLVAGLLLSAAVIFSVTVKSRSSKSVAAPATTENPSAKILNSSPNSGPARRFASPALVPTITATKTDALAVDNDSDNNADPGDTLRYTVTVGVTGTDATGVVFSDTVDPNTAFVAGSLRTTPLARPDSYTASGNIRINVNAASGVLSNDQDFDGVGPSVTATAGVFLSANGGNVTLNADGSFSYNPPAGFEGTDTFNYTLNDNDSPNQTDTSTVSITVSGMIWFINNNVGSAGDGRLTSPFNTLAAFEAVNGNGGNNPAANDNIFIYESNTAYVGPVLLEANQKVIGQDANGASLDALAGITLAPNSDPLPALSPGGTLVTITTANAITVAQGNTLRGFTVGASTTDISGNNFGTLTMFDISLTGGGEALNLTNGNLSATSNISIASTSGATGLSLNDVGGSLTTTGTTTISGSTGNGIFVQSSRSGALFNFGNTSVTTTGGVGVRLDNNVGNVTFADLDITPNAGQRALHATNSVANSGTITTTSGTISASSAIAVEVNRTAGTLPLVMSLTSVSANGGTNGIVLTNTNGSFTITGDGGSVNNSSGGTIQNTTSHAIALSNAQNISLDQVNIQSAARSGINGTLVDNFTLTNSTLNNTGTSGTADLFNSAVFFGTQAAGTEQNLTGVVTITGNTLTAMKHHGISIANFAGTISDANISNNSITSPTSTATSTGTGIQLLTFATNATTKAHLSKATINDNDVFNFPSDAGVMVQCQNVAEGSVAGTCGTNSSTNAINITNNTISGQSAANRMGTQGILFNANGTVTAFFNVTGNTVTNTVGNAISHNVFGDSVVNSVTSNNIVTPNQPAASIGSRGIAGGIGATGTYVSNTASLTWKLENNNVSATDGSGIQVLSGVDDTDGTVNVTIRNNTVAAPGGSTQGIAVRHNGNASADPTICLDISGNTSAAGGGNPALMGIGLRKAGTNSAIDVFGIEGLAPSPATAAQTVTFVNGQNPAGGGTLIISGDNFVSCGTAPNSAVISGKSATTEQKGGAEPATQSLDTPPDDPSQYKLDPPYVPLTTNPQPPAAITSENSADAAAKKAQGDKLGILSASAGEGRSDDPIQKLSQRDLSWMVQVAISTWREAGISIEELQRMEAVRFELADLPDGQLAVETSSSVQIDETAASYGWFVDYSPQENSEFEVPVPGRELQLTDSSSAFGRIDLLTVVLRALAPKLSQDNLKNFSRRNALMNGTLGPGVRRLPVLSWSKIGKAQPARTAPVSAKSQTGVTDQPIARLANRRTSAGMKHHATFSPRPGATLADVMINMGLVPAGKTITITFDATVDSPWQGASNQVCNQGTVTADGGISVQTDDPSVGGPADATCTQIDQPNVTVAVLPSSVLEDGGTNLVYTFTREGSTAASLTVNFSVTGTATFNTDYTQTGAATFNASAGTVTIPAGSSTATVDLDPATDTTVEGDETAILTVTSGTSYDVGVPASATGTITNDDTDVTVAVSPSSVNEDDATNLVYTFTRVGVTSSALTVSFSVGGTATFGVDYGQTGATTFTLTDGTVEFAAGSSTAMVTVDPTTDALVEPNETVTLTLTTGTGYNVATPSDATGTITNDDAEVTIGVSPSAVEEDGATNLTYTFTRTGDTTTPLVVNFTIGGTATFGAAPNDYTQTGATSFSPPNGTVTIGAGSSTATITVDPEADAVAEPNETVILTLAASVDYNIGTPSSATGTINNDDTTVSVAVSPLATDEDSGTNLVYTFTRSDSDGALTVNFSVGGTATFGASPNDYTQTGADTFSPPNGTVTFANGSLTATVTVDPAADSTVELDETVILTVVAGAGYAVGAPSSASGTITNDDTDVSVAVAPSSTAEDGAGNLVYTFTRNGVTTGSLTANFTVSGTATLNDDYTASGADSFTATNGTVTFGAGSSTAMVTVDPSIDTTVEPDETVILTVAAGTGYNVAAVNNSATGTISNDDTDVSIAVAPGSVNEDGATNLVYTLTRAGATSGPLTVNFTIGGTATFGVSPDDYTQTGADTFSPPNGTVTFVAGSPTATVTINPEADTTTEPDETVTLTLASGTGYNVVEPSSATGTILDDDITVSVGVSPAAVNEDGGNLVYTFTRPDSSGPLTVNFTIGGSATFGASPNDYTQTGADTFSPPNGTVTFADGSLTATVTVDPAADSVVETDETVTLTVVAGAGYIVGSPSSATGTITNDDTEVSVAVSPLSTTEDGAGNLAYTFTRTGVTAGVLTASFSVGGTATFNTDYTETGAASFGVSSGTVTFGAGSSTAVVTIDPTADGSAEADESVILTVVAAPGYNVGSPNPATGTITNDDTEVSVAVAPSSVLEDGATNMVYTFTRAGITSGALTVNFSVGGTAIFAPPDTDYTATTTFGDSFTATSGTVTFAAGSSTAIVTVDPFGDTDMEPNETVILTVTPGAGYTVGTPAAATGTILNDDNSPPTIVVGYGQCGTVSTTSGTMNLTIGDVETPAASLTMSATSSNTAVVPLANISFGGSGANRTVTINAVPQLTLAFSDVTITVSDGTLTTSINIRVIVGTNKTETINIGTTTVGTDMIFGRNGDDTINAGAGNDLVCGGTNGGIINGGLGNDTLDGGQGNDTLRGGDDNDLLVGGVGNDTLEGGAGIDTLDAGTGNDTLTGGTGADVFNGGAGTDTATDFNAGEGDTRVGVEIGAAFGAPDRRGVFAYLAPSPQWRISTFQMLVWAYLSG